MINAKSTIKINNFAISKLTNAAKTALHQTAEALHTEVVQAQVIPFDTGNLQNESTHIDTSDINSGKVSIIHNTPYARRLYFHPEYNFSTIENPFAKGEWWTDWLPGGKFEKFSHKAFKEFYKKVGGL